MNKDIERDLMFSSRREINDDWLWAFGGCEIQGRVWDEPGGGEEGLSPGYGEGLGEYVGGIGHGEDD